MTAPAPRVVYQRTLLLTGQLEAPETAEAVPDDELTPLDGCRLLAELEDVADDEDEVVVDVPDGWPADADVPGMVAALTAPKRPTPATAAIAAPTVSRFSS